MEHIENVVIGNPLCSPIQIFAKDFGDWEKLEKGQTIFTEERFLPRILVNLGIVKSVSEIRRNKPQLCVTLEEDNFMEVKWGKHKLFILVGKLGRPNKFLGEPFLNQCAKGESEPDDIEDFIEYWHSHEINKELHEYLGFNEEEYSKWLIESDDVINEFIERRKCKV